MLMDKEYHGSCHCGSVKFTVVTNTESALRCNCSLCIRKGAIMLSGKEGSFVLTEGEDQLGQYQFNTHVASTIFVRTVASIRITNHAQILKYTVLMQVVYQR